MARVWQFRHGIEQQAAHQFSQMVALYQDAGLPREFARLAAQARDDEHNHVALCRSIVHAFDPSVDLTDSPQRGLGLGPRDLSAQHKALYSSVAMSCVMESFSTALLVKMREVCEEPLIKKTIDTILKDEVGHARLGWMHLEYAKDDDNSWLLSHIPAMIKVSLRCEVLEIPRTSGSLEAYGILSHESATQVAEETLMGLLIPGFAHFALPVQIDSVPWQ